MKSPTLTSNESEEFNLKKLVKTREDADLLDSEVDLMLTKLYSNKENLEKVLEEEIRQSTFQAIRNELEKSNNSLLKIKEFLEKIKGKLAKLKTLELTIAFEPTQAIINDIYFWVSENISEQIVLSIRQDKSLLGGAVIVFEGLYKDYTLKKQLNKVFEEKKEEIINLVK